jgi:hypothetical protein
MPDEALRVKSDFDLDHVLAGQLGSLSDGATQRDALQAWVP